jgi:hypothetical protein
MNQEALQVGSPCQKVDAKLAERGESRIAIGFVPLERDSDVRHSWQRGRPDGTTSGIFFRLACTNLTVVAASHCTIHEDNYGISHESGSQNSIFFPHSTDTVKSETFSSRLQQSSMSANTSRGLEVILFVNSLLLQNLCTTRLCRPCNYYVICRC